jgi:nitrogenase molybdenum-iron protein alpha/beta subunit
MGVEVVACITGDGRVDDIRRAHGAALNVVQCSGSMMHLAKSLKEKFGTPFKRVSYFGIEDMAQPFTTLRTSSNREDYDQLRELCDEGTIIVDDSNPLELASFLQEKHVDLFIGGVKERPIAYKLGIGFCDHNHERKLALAGFEGMVNFAREVHSTVMNPVWKLSPRQRKAAVTEMCQ